MSLPARQSVKLINCRVNTQGRPINPDLHIDEQFEYAIHEYRNKGFVLHSWTLSTSPVQAEGGAYLLTLVAVFQWQNPTEPNYTGVPL